MDRYTTLAARQMFEDGRRASWFDILMHAAAGVLSQLHPARRISRRHARPHHLGDERVLRRPQIREALGAVFALHIDTARTWRGGQNQVLLTVLGLARPRPPGRARRARGGRALSARVRRSRSRPARAAQRGRPVGRVEAVAHHPPVETADRARARSACGRDGGAGAVVRRARPAAAHRRLAARRLSPAERIRFRGGSTGRSTCSSPRRDAIRDILEHDGIAGRADRRRARRHRRRARSAGCPAVDIHAEFWLPHGAPVIVNVGALVDHKGQKYLVEAMPHVLREVPDAHLVIFGEGELRARARAADQGAAPREARAARRDSARMSCSW